MPNSNSPTISQLSDTQLVIEFQQTHNNAFFAALYQRYFSKVRIYCLKSLGDRSRADDVTQDVLLKAYEKLNTLQNPQLWVAWLFRIARNQVLNIHKKATRSHLEPVAEYLSISEEPTEQEAVEAYNRKLDALPTLLDEVPAGRILKLKYIEGQTIEQLCQNYNLNESAIKMRLLRARQHVVQLYEQRYASA
jgi:RNA polymerase sigma factor (sigma-70 family)